MSASHFPVPSLNPTVIPIELFEALDQAYFLHLLATDPDKVLPPGKSLLSMMSRSHFKEERPEGSHPTLHDKIEDLVHRAFWDEAVESLSDPEPSVQLSRLKLLYRDLLVALTPLLPTQHPVIVLLSSPLSPTPSPLQSAIYHILEVLASLRGRCAPARDEYIDTLIDNLDDPPPPSLPKLIVDTVRSILRFADVMKDDLSQFVLGTMGERQLRAVVIQQAVARERSVVLELWRPPLLSEHWKLWLGDVHTPEGHDSPAPKWVTRLVEALGSSQPVTCIPPLVAVDNPVAADPSPGRAEAFSLDKPTHFLPPPFFFSCPALLYIQNYIQALVITASLRSLVQLPSHQPRLSSQTPNGVLPESDFVERIWVLLRAEIDDEDGAGETKLINLADEVLRAQQNNHPDTPIDAVEEAHLRAAVKRTLQPHDPVFVLLRKRLITALSARQLRDQVLKRVSSRVPEHMRTGREPESGEKPMHLALENMDLARGLEEREIVDDLNVKGFESPLLVQNIKEAIYRIRCCIRWVEETWSDVIAN